MRRVVIFAIGALCLLSTVSTVSADEALTMALGTRVSERVSLKVERLPLSAALSMLASKYGINMVVSGADETHVSVALTDISIPDALHALLFPNGFSYTVTGNVLSIGPLEKLGPGALSAITYRLAYITPEAAKKAVTPLLSPDGKVEILSPDAVAGTTQSVTPTTLLVRDYAPVIAMAQRVLAQVDVRERMVMIEVRMIESKVNSADIVGFTWPASATVRIQEPLQTGVGVPVTQQQRRAGHLDFSNGQWQWGALNLDELSATLDFLSSSGNSKLVSHPKLATRENHTAEFKVATIVPVQTINRFNEAGATSDIVTFQDIEVGISLKVTPRINDSDTISLDVFPIVQEIIGFAGSGAQQKPITSERSVHTVVTCKAGETIVVGGLLKENQIKTKNKVFLLGDIPGLGALFTHTRDEKENTDLVIMITPTIMR